MTIKPTAQAYLTFEGQGPKRLERPKKAVSASPKNTSPSKWPAAGLLGPDLVRLMATPWVNPGYSQWSGLS